MVPMRIDELRGHREAALAQATAALRRGDIQSAHEALQAARAYADLLAAHPLRPHRTAVTLTLLGGFVLLVVGSLLLIPQAWLVHPTYILDITASSASLVFRQPLELEPALSGTDAEVREPDSVTATALSARFEGKSVTVSLHGQTVTLSQLGLKPSGTLSFTRSAKALVVDLHGDVVSAGLLVQGADASAGVRPRGDDTATTTGLDASEIPERVMFDASGRGSVPLEVALDSPQPWTLRGLKPVDVRFVDQVPLNGRDEVVSSVLDGQIRLLDTDREVKLEVGDSLILDGLETKRFEVSSDKDAVHVRIEGKIRSVMTGPRGLESDLGPSLLQWIASNAVWRSIIAIVVSLFSLAWALWRLLGEARS